LPKARAAKNQKVKEILASLDVESENMSIISSVDTEALLLSSDEEEEEEKVEKDHYKRVKENIKKKEQRQYFSNDGQRGVAKALPVSGKGSFLSIDTTSVLSLVPKKLSLEKSSMLVCRSKSGSLVLKPSQVLGNLKPTPTLHTMRVCSCIMSGSLFKHFPSCKPISILSSIPQRSVPAPKPRKSFIQSVLIIQRGIRNYLNRKQTRQTAKPIQSSNPYLSQATSTLSSAYKQLEALRSLASEQSSDLSLDGSDYEGGSIDTDSLLNSSFSSIFSRH